MTRPGLFGGVLFALSLVVSACSNNNSAPSPVPTPTTPTPTPTVIVSSITVTSSQAGPTTYQLQASARMSDGSTRDVTSAAQWDSSNPALCQIASTGLLTATHSGSLSVRATYQNVVGSANLTLTVPIFSLTGIISEAPPVSRLFEGVKVTLTAGANKDQFTYSDDRGLFTFNGLSAGTHTLSINHAGYQPWTQTVNLTENVTNLSVVLYPAPAPTAMPATSMRTLSSLSRPTP